MVNFDTDRLIIVFYKAGSGGKFVANALGLSTGAVFQDPFLAEQQLRGELSSADKLRILVERINQNSVDWDDLRMGCQQLFGFSSELYVKDFVELKTQWQFRPVIEELSNSNTYFTVMANDVHVLKRMLQVWPNAGVVIFDNPRSFMTVIRPNYMPPAEWADYTNDYDRIELEKLKNIVQNRERVYNWDCTRFFHTDQTVQGVNQLYDSFGLEDFSARSIDLFHNKWLSKLEELRDLNEQ